MYVCYVSLTLVGQGSGQKSDERLSHTLPNVSKKWHHATGKAESFPLALTGWRIIDFPPSVSRNYLTTNHSKVLKCSCRICSEFHAFVRAISLCVIVFVQKARFLTPAAGLFGLKTATRTVYKGIKHSPHYEVPIFCWCASSFVGTRMHTICEFATRNSGTKFSDPLLKRSWPFSTKSLCAHDHALATAIEIPTSRWEAWFDNVRVKTRQGCWREWILSQAPGHEVWFVDSTEGSLQINLVSCKKKWHRTMRGTNIIIQNQTFATYVI